jgi:hypothetical protein
MVLIKIKIRSCIESALTKKPIKNNLDIKKNPIKIADRPWVKIVKNISIFNLELLKNWLELISTLFIRYTIRKEYRKDIKTISQNKILKKNIFISLKPI